MKRFCRLVPASLLVGSIVCPAWAQPTLQKPESSDVVLADFEAKDFGAWHVEGQAFGNAPAKGTLANQMDVRGYQGKGLANGYHGGDGAVGKLVSPSFRIERDFIHFLIGGGQNPEQLAMRLLIDGKPVRHATGNQARPGGQERLDLQGWDVKAFKGQHAQIEIVDEATGGWGHLIVDQIIQSDRPAPIAAVNVQRVLPADAAQINFPISRAAPMRRMQVLVNGQEAREFDLQFAEGEPDFWVPYDIAAFEGETVAVQIDQLNDAASLAHLRFNGDFPTDVPLYQEKHRPQFHFTSARGWLNDPNGMVHQDGVWHLYYQHNPFGTQWDNMTWGHATSKDLIHWEQQPIGLFPQNAEDMAFSGSAVIDHDNTSGWGTPGNPALVAGYTSTGRGECIVYSTDGGKSFTEFEGNPVVKHQGRDPRLQWHAPSKQWSMVVYGEGEGRQWFDFYTSPDLKEWTYQSRRMDWFECPDLLELPLDGDADNTQWMLLGASGHYELGGFNGKAFEPNENKRHQVFFGDCYAGQRYTNTPEGRMIYIGWARHLHRGEDHQQRAGMPFNQQMTIPMTLTLATTQHGPRVLANPVVEIEKLRTSASKKGKQAIGSQAVVLGEGELLDVEVELTVGQAKDIVLNVRGLPVVYKASENKLVCGHVEAPVHAQNGKLTLRVLADRMGLEIFANGGEQVLFNASVIDVNQTQVTLKAEGGKATLNEAVVHNLKSAW